MSSAAEDLYTAVVINNWSAVLGQFREDTVGAVVCCDKNNVSLSATDTITDRTVLFTRKGGANIIKQNPSCIYEKYL